MVKTISLNGLTIEEASSYLIKNGFIDNIAGALSCVTNPVL